MRSKSGTKHGAPTIPRAPTKPGTGARRGGAAKTETIDAWMATVDPDKRAALQKLRKAIHAAVPGLAECISYQMPAFRYNGKVLVWFGAGKHHCAFYPGGITQAFVDELEGYETSKGTIRFQPDHPLPAALVRKIVKARAGST